MTTAAVVLAAGGGARFAARGHKLRAPFRGRPLASWAIEAAVAAGLADVIVVWGAVDLSDLLPDGAVAVENTRWAEGQATSLQAGIEEAGRRGHTAVVVGLADQPLIPPAAWIRVTGAAGGPIVVATYAGRRGHPVRLDAEVWPLLPTDGDEGARGLMRGRPELVVEVACAGEPADMDTAEDVARWS